MGFAKWGYPELVKFTFLALLLAGSSYYLCNVHFGVPVIGWALVGVFSAFALFVISFFRDPPRRIGGEALDIVSPADGTVTDVSSGPVMCEEFIEGEAHWVGIFLSVFNCHINRSPLDCEVKFLRYKQGKFLDARDPDCGRINEQQIIGAHASAANNGKFVVKQIAGAIARRIICPLKPNETLSRGEKFGMIKFGSRTELWIDAATCDVEWKVKVGDKLKGGSSIIGRITPKAQQG
ncbi:MAG: phosphatidylserine decarboxylase family protein [Planctomycetes bacterium]|nr:phosphatidylserine decarboxylase family protein [Planctomycetota bacterium]